ncbi:MAG: glycine betaine ABC transporter substrate-binding protein [Thermaerobacterales bacterium]
MTSISEASHRTVRTVNASGNRRRPRRIAFMLASLLAAALLLAACGGADTGDTVRIGVGPPWTTTQAPAYIMKAILEDKGYEVEMINGDIGFMFSGVASDDIDILPDAWVPTQNSYLTEYGEVEQTAVSYTGAQAGIFVPAYMNDLNTVDDLAGNEHLFDHEMVCPGAGTATHGVQEAMLEGEYRHLDFELICASEAGLWTVAAAAAENQEPIVFGFWQPHALFAQHDFKLLEDPHDHFPPDTVTVITTPSLRERLPEVHAFVSNWNWHIDEISQLLLRLEEDEYKDDPAKLGRDYVEENREWADAMWPSSN